MALHDTTVGAGPFGEGGARDSLGFLGNWGDLLRLKRHGHSPRSRAGWSPSLQDIPQDGSRSAAIFEDLGAAARSPKQGAKLIANSPAVSVMGRIGPRERGDPT